MRYLFKLFVILLMALAIVVSAQELYAVNNPEKPEMYTLHRVKDNETLWNISKQYMPNIDARLGVGPK